MTCRVEDDLCLRYGSVGNRQRAVVKKLWVLPIALGQLRAFRTGLEKIANRPITLDLTPGDRCYFHISYFIRKAL